MRARSWERFTEFFTLGRDGTADNYPTKSNVTEGGTVVIGVANREFVRVDYFPRVDLLSEEQIWNETGGHNETVEINRTSMISIGHTLDHGMN